MTGEITPAHICGLVVGEGCFYVESAPDPKYKSGWRIRPAFCIEMRHDDRDALEAVMHYLDCGAIYELDFGRYRGYEDKGWAPHVKYRVGSVRDLYTKVVPFFRQHRLFGRKEIAFDLFAQIVDLIYHQTHRQADGLQEGKKLAAALQEHNRRAAPHAKSTPKAR